MLSLPLETISHVTDALLLPCLLALDALVRMETSAAMPDHPADKLLADGLMVANLLTLAAQFALEVGNKDIILNSVFH